MQATLEHTNGQDVYADMERHVRRNAELPTASAVGFHDFLKEAKGVIHVGAHAGQERDLYGDRPVVWVEALPMVFDVLCEKIADRPNQRAVNCLVADGKPHKFGLASNACQSSSIFDLKGHKAMWPEVGYVAATEMESVTLAELIEREGIDPDVYDTLVLDLQGAELLVLQGAGEYLQGFRFIQAEAADFEAYEGGCQLKDLDAFLAPRGFARVKKLCGKAMDGVGSYFDVVYKNVGSSMQHAACETNGRGGKEPTPEEAVEHRQVCDEIDRVAAEAGWTKRNAKQPLRLNLGAGGTHLAGFTDVDRKLGTEVYPLPYPDESIEELVASHVLEHFSHRDTSLVLQDWVRVLKPGGKIRLAVPDFEEVARLYLEGAAVNVQGYVMGGHNDADDRHGCVFDREALTELMVNCGLERIGPWDFAAFGCAAGPHSLNLQGFKPSGPPEKLTGIVRAVMSVPRFGPLMHPRCAERAFHQLGIEARSTSSCYWAQQISNCMEDAIASPGCEFVLTMDFDTIFSAADVLELYHLLRARPDVDAAIPLQAKRSSTDMLFSLPGKTPGTVRAGVSESDLAMNLLPANTGHFGLTLFRAASLRKFPRPWMRSQPNAHGLWRDGHTDADIDFWRNFRAAGFKACVAPKVVVGHLEEVVSWPGKDLTKVYQSPAEYDEVGIPAEVAR